MPDVPWLPAPLPPPAPPPPPPVVYWIFAHPDDETLAAGAAMFESQQAGVRNVVLILSSGENTVTRIRLGLSKDQIKAARAAEATAALATIGIKDVRFLGLPEGMVTPDVVSSVIGGVLAEAGDAAQFRGNSPYDSYLGLPCGHVDHCAVGRGLLAAFQDGRVKNLIFYRESHYFDGKRSSTCAALSSVQQTAKRAMAAEYALYKPSIGRYGIASQSVPGAWYRTRTEPECTDLPAPPV